MNYRDIVRSISGPQIPAAVTTLRRFLTTGDIETDDALAEPGLVQAADGAISIVDADGNETPLGAPTASLLESVVRVITSAEILGMRNNPVELLPAEEGRMALPTAITGLRTAGTTPYTLANSLNVVSGDWFLTGALPSLAAVFGGSPEQICGYNTISGTNSAGESVGGPVTLRASGASDPTDGDLEIMVELFYLRFPPVV